MLEFLSVHQVKKTCKCVKIVDTAVCNTRAAPFSHTVLGGKQATFTTAHSTQRFHGCESGANHLPTVGR